MLLVDLQWLKKGIDHPANNSRYIKETEQQKGICLRINSVLTSVLLESTTKVIGTIHRLICVYLQGLLNSSMEL